MNDTNDTLERTTDLLPSRGDLLAELNARSHPAAQTFPLLADNELNELVADIKKNGLRHLIVTDRNKIIIDGRNRYLACRLAGIEPSFIVLEDGADPVTVITSHNIYRRHLSNAQRAAFAADLAAGDDHTSANLPTAISQEQAAKAMKVATRSVVKANRIKKRSPVLHAAMKANKVAADAADKILDITDDIEREEAIAAVVSGNTKAAKAITQTRRPIRPKRFAYHDLIAALEDLPRQLKSEPPDDDEFNRLGEVITAAVQALRGHEQALQNQENTNDA